jgi:hypothetical protein
MEIFSEQTFCTLLKGHRWNLISKSVALR